jgi:hypothetical protein
MVIERSIPSKERSPMAYDTDATVVSPPTEPVPRSPAAVRMRSHRERRRRGLRCLTIELRETEIDALIRKGLLKPETRNEIYELQMALYAFLDRTLGAK